MNYFFIPGRHTDLSLAELKSVFNLHLSAAYTINSKSANYFLVRTDAQPDVIHRCFARLGGFIKYGRVIDQERFLEDQLTDEGDHITFGMNIFPFDNSGELHRAKVAKYSREIKRLLQEAGKKVRYIRPEDSLTLSSAQIFHNKILDQGFDLNIMELGDDSRVAGITAGVQDFQQFISNDYGRPEIDTEMGMLPPKLARMMVNLAQVPEGGIIWDPFCGSGTILVEALMLGYNVVGSDIDPVAVDSTEKNIMWAAKEHGLKDLKYNTFQWDVTKADSKLRSKLRQTKIDALVFEPYMGPPQKKMLHPGRAEKLLSRVSELYKPFFEYLENINQHNLIVVAVLPEYRTFKGWIGTRYSTFLSKRWEVINNKMNEKDLHWSRSNSIIVRNILILRLKR